MVLLVLDDLPERLAKGQLDEVLQLRVDVAPDAVAEGRLHLGHQHLQALDHSDHLDQRELLVVRVVVARGLVGGGGER